MGENNRELSYTQPWVKYAIPSSKTGLERCVRYAPNNTLPSGYQCEREYFNVSNRIECTEFVYQTDETNIQTEVINILLTELIVMKKEEILMKTIKKLNLLIE